MKFEELFETGITPNCVTEDECVPTMALLPTTTTVWHSPSNDYVVTYNFNFTLHNNTKFCGVQNEADLAANATVAQWNIAWYVWIYALNLYSWTVWTYVRYLTHKFINEALETIFHQKFSRRERLKLTNWILCRFNFTLWELVSVFIFSMDILFLYPNTVF